MSGGHRGPEDRRGHTGAIRRRSAGVRNGSLTRNDLVPNMGQGSFRALGSLKTSDEKGEREREKERRRDRDAKTGVLYQLR